MGTHLDVNHLKFLLMEAMIILVGHNFSTFDEMRVCVFE